MPRNHTEFQTIHSEGGLLPADLLRRAVDPKGNLPGAKPEDYGLPQGERINEAITQSWNRMRRHWAEFRTSARNLPENEPGTGLTNDKWSVPLLRELGFGLIPSSPGPEVAGRTYAINRFFGPTAIHLVGCGVNLDRRAAGVRGAAAANPHGLVQEFLNRSPGHLWAIVSNGLRFRILRDNQALSRQSYLDFDLEAMFAGEVYSDFVLLWLMAHATRFAPQTDGRPDTCYLEQWTKVANEEGTRALGDLRAGVEKALQILGEAFVSHPRNTALREALRSQQLRLGDFHGQLLRLVYRLIFLFVAEDRTLDGVSLLHPRDDSEPARLARERFEAHYGTTRLRDLAGKIKGSRHGDLWQQFNLLVGALSGDERFTAVRQNLALPTLGSFLWNPASTAALNAASLAGSCGVELANSDLLEALRHLAYTRQGKVLRPVDYKNLGAEELGGVYESLLALTPQISGDGARFTFAEFAGNERKTSGSYYTPDSLVQCLLDSALDPVVEEALKGKSGAEAEQAILNLKVCDPAVGSGHFLVGAAHRLARHLARVRANAEGESEPSPLLYQHALRDVIGRCLYGVDINPMAAELCRVSLWLEALEPGKPLSFLDHHIQVGNSLLGTTPALLATGIPDDAFTPIEGDEKSRCTELKKQNKKEREEYRNRQGYLFDVPYKLGNLAAELARVNEAADDSPQGVAEKERRYTEFVRGSGYQFGRLLADTWCAAFVWKKDNSDLGKLCPTERDFRKVESHATAGLLPHVRAEVERLRVQYQFFHWHLCFPDVFRLPGKDESPVNQQTGWNGGFDVVLGNPPWEKVQPEATKFFAKVRPDIAFATSGDERAKLLNELVVSDPSIATQWKEHQREVGGFSHLLKHSGFLCASIQGNLNLYRLFFDLATVVVESQGRAGMVVQSGLVTDQSASPLLVSLLSNGRLVRALDFENRAGFFPDVDSRFRFTLATALGLQHYHSHECIVGMLLQSIDELSQPDRLLRLTLDDVRRFSPDAPTIPVFKSAKEFYLTRTLYNSGHPFSAWEDGTANVQCLGEFFNMNRDSGLFRENSSQDSVRVYEAKCIHQFDHRYSEFSGSDYNDSKSETKADPDYVIRTHYYVNSDDYYRRCDRTGVADRGLIGWRDIASATNERTVIASALPKCGVGHNMNILHSLAPVLAPLVVANLNCIAFDFLARQKVSGTHVTISTIKQLPVLNPTAFTQSCQWARSDSRREANSTVSAWLLPRVQELTYTAWDLEPFARDSGYAGPPFRWDEERRFLLRAELDAAFFHLYLRANEHGDWVPARKADGCPSDESPEDLARLKAGFPKPRDAVSYIMDTFPIVRRKDEEKYNGDYRTKRVILEIYDAMQESIRTFHPYQTRLDPPPADPRIAHPPRKASRPQLAFVDPAFPSTSRDRYLCAALLDLVQRTPGLPAIAYLDELGLATHTTRCKLLLAGADRQAFSQALRNAATDLVSTPDAPVPWRDLRSALVGNRSIQDENTVLSPGDNFGSVRGTYPAIDGRFLGLVAKAAERLRELQAGATAIDAEENEAMVESRSWRESVPSA